MIGFVSRFFDTFLGGQSQTTNDNQDCWWPDYGANSGWGFWGGSSFDLRVAIAPHAAPAATNDLGQLYLLSDSGQLSPVTESTSSGTSSTTAYSTTTSTRPAPTLVGATGGLQFDLIWDSSVAKAPSGFEQAAIKAASLYTQMYSNKEVIDVHVGFGEIAGSALDPGALAESESYGYYESYTQVRSGLLRDASSSFYQSMADASLPITDPTRGGTFFVSTAEAKAWGQASTGLDGYIGLSSSYPFDYNSPTTPVGPGQYDAIGAIAHELSEVMGRTGSVGSIYGSGMYTPLDLFRYSGSGRRDLSVGTAAGYFSINGGASNLGVYNNPIYGGDASDWRPTLVGDSYGDGYSGHSAHVSSTDLIEDSVLGYRMTAAALTATKTPGLA